MALSNESILARAAGELEEATANLTAAESLPAYQRFRKLEEHRLRLRISSGAGGREVVRQRSDLVDILFRRLYEQVLQGVTGGRRLDGLSVVAFGGYGRREMNPYSDVDIMFLHSGVRPSDEVAEVCHEVIRLLWDTGFKVGHSLRSIKQALEQANTDLQTKTSMLESRHLSGDREVTGRFKEEFEKRCVQGHAGEYLAWRAANMAEMHAQYGGSIYMQEPNVKHGMGGLRDYQNLLWVGYFKHGVATTAKLVEKKVLGDSERRLVEKAYDFLLRVRTEMHFINKRPIDILTLYLQGQVSNRLGYSHKHILKRVEAFMRDYYRHTRDLYRISSAACRRMAPVPVKPAGGFLGLFAAKPPRMVKFDGFVAHGGLLFAESGSVFTQDPQRLMRAFLHAQVRQLELSPELRDQIRRRLRLVDRTFQYSRAARETFLEILSHRGAVGPALRAMHEVDFLGRYIPEFRPLTCLVQHEFFHRYTADEHTLVCLEKLDALLDTPDPKLKSYRALFQKVEDPAVLYLALLLHDTGKSENRRHHEEVSAMKAQRVARRLQLSPERRRSLILLVDNHYTLSKTAQSRNLDDPATIAWFAGIVQSVENLDALMLITLADGQGTSDEQWSDWKEGLVWQLYRSTRSYLQEGQAFFELRKVNMLQQQQEVLRKLPPDFREEAQAHFEYMPERYFRMCDTAAVAEHVKLFRRFFENRLADGPRSLEPVFQWVPRPDLGHSEVWICGWDRNGLIARVSGAFLAAGINVLSADIFTRGDNLVLDIFRVCDTRRQPVTSERDIRAVERVLCDSLEEEDYDFTPLILKSRRRLGYRMSQEAEIPTRITVDNRSHPSCTIVDVETPDRMGLLYDLFWTLHDLGLRLELARITTEMDVAIDTFYVRHDATGQKLSSEAAVRRLQKALHTAAVCSRPDTTGV